MYPQTPDDPDRELNLAYRFVTGKIPAGLRDRLEAEPKPDGTTDLIRASDGARVSIVDMGEGDVDWFVIVDNSDPDGEPAYLAEGTNLRTVIEQIRDWATA
jgi:hypothetical protein